MVPSGWVPLGSRLSKRCNGASSHARHAGSRIGDFASPSKSDSPTPRDKRANAEMQAHSTTTTLHASRPCTVARALASRSGRLRSDARPASAIARIVAFAIVCNMPSCRSRGSLRPLRGPASRSAVAWLPHGLLRRARRFGALASSSAPRGRGGLSETDSDGMRWQQAGSGSLGARATANATKQRASRRAAAESAEEPAAKSRERAWSQFKTDHDRLLRPRRRAPRRLAGGRRGARAEGGRAHEAHALRLRPRGPRGPAAAAESSTIGSGIASCIRGLFPAR